jgi:hypothetical protein
MRLVALNDGQRAHPIGTDAAAQVFDAQIAAKEEFAIFGSGATPATAPAFPALTAASESVRSDAAAEALCLRPRAGGQSGLEINPFTRKSAAR